MNKEIMFSLCIPTMDRYDLFLSKYLPHYLDNEFIEEIIITDENGNDIEKISQFFPDNKKLVLVKNETKLGPFLNKQKACSYAKNEWIALIDSDNFADKSYFLTAKKYIENNNITDKNVILAPCYAKPTFNYSHLSGLIYKKGNFKKNKIYEDNILNSTRNSIYMHSIICMNTGNYIINKYLIDNIDLSLETNNIIRSSACDVIYLNTLLFEQLDLQMHIVPHMEYEHVVHDGSIYTKTSHMFRDFNQSIQDKYVSIINNG